MAQLYGDLEIADRLKRARIAAGYGSMRGAAERFEWSRGTYSGHEAGTRRISEQEMAIYAAAFRCPLEWLRTGEAPRAGRAARFSRIATMPIADLEREYVVDRPPPTATPEIDVGRRLALACAIAGHGSVNGTAAGIGLRRGALGNYSGGRTRLPGLMSAIYGIALRVSPTWLRTGQLPSGLPLPDGLTEQDALAIVAEGGELPLAPTPPDAATRRIAAALDSAEQRRLATRSVAPEHEIRIPEWRPSDDASPSPGEWTVPTGLVGHVPEERRSHLAIVTIDAILGTATRIQAGDRIVVEIGRHGDERDLHVALDADQRFVIADPQSSERDLVGTVALYLGGRP